MIANGAIFPDEPKEYSYIKYMMCNFRDLEKIPVCYGVHKYFVAGCYEPNEADREHIYEKTYNIDYIK